MRILFMGTPDIAAECLKALYAAGHEICGVYTRRDKPVGRKQVLTAPPVKEVALEHGTPVFQPRTLRDGSEDANIRALAPDLIVVVAYGCILPKSVLEAPKYGCINLHVSLLPKYRGSAPVQWAVLNGDTETGVSIMQMDEGLDTGDMLLKGSLELAADETGGSLFDRLSTLGANLCAEALEKLPKGELKPEKQGESPTEYARMLTKDMGNLNWNESAEKLERLIRGLNPWPSAYTKLGDKTLKIWSARVCERAVENAACGEIIRVTKDTVCVACGEGALEITELQLQGKKRMDTGAFLRGYHLEPGTRLG